MFDLTYFYEAASVKDAVNALVQNPDSEVISGGTDVLIRMREGKDAGMGLVSIHNIEELKTVELLPDGDLKIGAGMSFTHVTKNPLIQKYVPMLGEAVDRVGGPQTRNAGTIGGNICNGATSADSAASMMALNAILVLEGEHGERQVPIAEFYTGPGRTVRERTEVLKYFLVRKEDFEGWAGEYIKYGKRKAMEIATLGCAARVKLSADKKTYEEVRLAYAVAAPTPIRCTKAEAFMKGKAVADEASLEEFIETAVTETKPRSSWRASKEFRLQLIRELGRRALLEAVRRDGGEVNA